MTTWLVTISIWVYTVTMSRMPYVMKLGTSAIAIP